MRFFGGMRCPVCSLITKDCYGGDVVCPGGDKYPCGFLFYMTIQSHYYYPRDAVYNRFFKDT